VLLVGFWVLFISLGLFWIVVVVAVQNAFRLEMHQNEFFYFLKSFLTITHQNNMKT
jgi:hypothetical protein